jgi:hypothetical protein
MNPALGTMGRAEPEDALARRLEVRNIQLKKYKPLVSAALHRAIRNSISKRHWPIISADALIDQCKQKKPNCPCSGRVTA